MFRSTNEIYNFDFQDAVIDNVKFNEDEIIITVNGLIIEPENSQNENFTKSYSDTTKIKLKNAKIISAIKDGYRRYDVNDKLTDEVPDQNIDNNEIKLILKNSKGAYLFAMDANVDSSEELFSYTVSIEFPNEDEYDSAVMKSYQIKFTFTQSVFEWNGYLNKVQN